MIIIETRIQEDRNIPGTITVKKDGEVLFERRCRGEADNTYARQHDNPDEDPTKIGGDHPEGQYKITAILRFDKEHPKYRTYGPAFLAITGIDGEAYLAHLQGRRGLAIHGGKLDAQGNLRATFGCLRVDDETAEQLADLVDEVGVDGVGYYCMIV